MAANKSPLTINEVEVIRETWKIISTDLKGYGVKLFIHFFTETPSNIKLFHDFSHVPVEEMPNDKKFRAHTFTFMSSMNGFINNLEDADILTGLWEKNAENHGRRGAQPDDVLSIKDGILSYLNKEFQDNEIYTASARNAWNKFLTWMVTSIQQAAKIAKEKSK